MPAVERNGPILGRIVSELHQKGTVKRCRVLGNDHEDCQSWGRPSSEGPFSSAPGQKGYLAVVLHLPQRGALLRCAPRWILWLRHHGFVASDRQWEKRCGEDAPPSWPALPPCPPLGSRVLNRCERDHPDCWAQWGRFCPSGGSECHTKEVG